MDDCHAHVVDYTAGVCSRADYKEYLRSMVSYHFILTALISFFINVAATHE
jgi:hypothetical protein